MPPLAGSKREPGRVTCGQFGYTLLETQLARIATIGQVVIERRQVQPAVVTQGLQLRGEAQARPLADIVQRLLAHPIPREKQRRGRVAAAAVVDGEREHPVQPRQAAFAPALVSPEQHLGVAAPPESHALGLQLGA